MSDKHSLRNPPGEAVTREGNWQLGGPRCIPCFLLILLDDLVKSLNAFLPMFPYLQSVQINNVKLFIIEIVPQMVTWLWGCNIR